MLWAQIMFTFYSTFVFLFGFSSGWLSHLFTFRFSSVLNDMNFYSMCFDTEKLTVSLSACILSCNTVAPLKPRRPKLTLQPKLKDVTHSARRASRKAERRWTDRLQVFFDMLKDHDQNTVQTEKQIFLRNYFTQLPYQMKHSGSSSAAIHLVF